MYSKKTAQYSRTYLYNFMMRGRPSMVQFREPFGYGGPFRINNGQSFDVPPPLSSRQ